MMKNSEFYMLLQLDMRTWDLILLCEDIALETALADE